MKGLADPWSNAPLSGWSLGLGTFRRRRLGCLLGFPREARAADPNAWMRAVSSSTEREAAHVGAAVRAADRERDPSAHNERCHHGAEQRPRPMVLSADVSSARQWRRC